MKRDTFRVRSAYTAYIGAFQLMLIVDIDFVYTEGSPPHDECVCVFKRNFSFPSKVKSAALGKFTEHAPRQRKVSRVD